MTDAQAPDDGSNELQDYRVCWRTRAPDGVQVDVTQKETLDFDVNMLQADVTTGVVTLGVYSHYAQDPDLTVAAVVDRIHRRTIAHIPCQASVRACRFSHMVRKGYTFVGPGLVPPKGRFNPTAPPTLQRFPALRALLRARNLQGGARVQAAQEQQATRAAAVAPAGPVPLGVGACGTHAPPVRQRRHRCSTSCGSNRRTAGTSPACGDRSARAVVQEVVGQPGARLNVGKLGHAAQSGVYTTAAAGTCAVQNRIGYVFVCGAHAGGRAGDPPWHG